MDRSDFFKLLERFAILVLPSGQSIGAPTVYDSRSRARAAKFYVLEIDVQAVFFLEDLFLDEAVAERERVLGY